MYTARDYVTVGKVHEDDAAALVVPVPSAYAGQGSCHRHPDHGCASIWWGCQQIHGLAPRHLSSERCPTWNEVRQQHRHTSAETSSPARLSHRETPSPMHSVQGEKYMNGPPLSRTRGENNTYAERTRETPSARWPPIATLLDQGACRWMSQETERITCIGINKSVSWARQVWISKRKTHL